MLANHRDVRRPILERVLYMTISRRHVLAASAALPLLAGASPSASSARQKIVVAGGHPGDPECGCAGTIARYTDLGHDVVILYLNRGEGYCGEADLSRCGSIRTGEALRACEILKARAVFAGQYDSRAIVDNSHYEEFTKLLLSEKADVVFTQWPIDRHRDHRAVATLTLDAWLQSKNQFSLYYYEVADDTMMFSPGDYVDISSVESRRHAACYAHASQLPDKWYPAQVRITRFRGSESGYPQAEAFLRHWQSKTVALP